MSETLLLNSLSGVRRRVRLLTFIHGAGLLVAAFVGLLIATVFLDYLLNLTPIPRIVVMAGAVFGACYVATRFLFRPLLARLKLTDVAGRVEQAFPAFDDRLRSVVDFAAADNHDSAAMKRRVVDQATDVARELNLSEVVRPRPAWNAIGVAAAAIAVCLSLAALMGPDYLSVAFSRLLTPFEGRAWPKRTQIAIVGQVPLRITAGTPLDVRMKLVKGDKPSARAIVYYQYELGDGQPQPVQQEIMTRNPDGTYSADLDTRIEAASSRQSASLGVMKVWMRSGDDGKQLPPVEVVPPLTIKQVEAVVTPPRYADLPATTFDLAAAPLTVTVASTVQLRTTFSKPLAEGVAPQLAPIGPDGAAPLLTWHVLESDPSVAIGSFVARQSAHFKILATDRDSFSNSGIEEYQILVRPDQIPSIQFEKPIRNEESTVEASIPIQAEAEDDFGINAVDLMVRRLADNKTWTIPLVSAARPTGPEVEWHGLDAAGDLLRFRMNWDWLPAKLDSASLKAGDELEFYLRVQDNYVDEQGHLHNPPYSESGRLRLTIISQQELTQQLNEQLSQLRARVEETRNQLESLRTLSHGLHGDTKNKPALDRADRNTAQQIATDQGAAASQTKQIAEQLGQMQERMQRNQSPDSDMAADISQARKILDDAAENPMKDAAARLSEIADAQRAVPASQRNESLEQAQRQQAAASDQLQAAMDKMGAQAGLAQFLKQLSELLEKQQKLSNQSAQTGKNMLGKDPSQLSDDDKKSLAALAQQQQSLAQQTDQAMTDMNKSADQQARTDPASSQALKQAAQTGQQQNVPGQMSQAAKSEQQNQQADAQTAQQQAEIGLMVMLNQLKEAENRRLLELIKQLDTAQQLVADLLQQQAGHNLDNLNLQGVQAFALAIKADPDMIRQLFDDSQRDPKQALTPPPLETLIALQAQTERNTRNIVSIVQALPQGADPAADLTRASQQMSRAVSYFQDHRLPDAYQPPQVEAYASLLSAKQALDKQAAQAHQRLADQQKETLRQEYVRLREDQVKIADKTKAIDADVTANDGHPNHAAKAGIGILSGQQADLSHRAAKLNDDLVAIGSVAYTYANNDIVTRMNRAGDLLGNFDPGTPTQRMHARIILELDDMIKNLAIRPKQSQFSNPRQGGGGGQGSGQRPPRLPPEAEIRLVQDMQRMLNTDTKEAGDAPAVDKLAVLDLGKRQGDLRNLLDNLLKKTSDGKTTLGPEPQNKDTLPEEASDEDLDLQELKDASLNPKADEQGIKDDTHMIGVRMARARQRLALNADPGETTQKIQDRIVIELESLAKMAQQQEATANSSGGQRSRPQRQGQPGQPQPGDNPGNSLAQGQRNQNPQPNRPNSGSTPGGNTAGLSDTDITASVDELKDSWGKLSPRQRAAVMEGATDQTIQKFKDYVDGYYRTLATKAQQQ